MERLALGRRGAAAVVRPAAFIADYRVSVPHVDGDSALGRLRADFLRFDAGVPRAQQLSRAYLVSDCVRFSGCCGRNHSVFHVVRHDLLAPSTERRRPAFRAIRKSKPLCGVHGIAGADRAGISGLSRCAPRHGDACRIVYARAPWSDTSYPLRAAEWLPS